MLSDSVLEKKLYECCLKGLLVPHSENNPYLKVSYKGAGSIISNKWNVKIYTSGSVVCNDPKILNDIRSDKLSSPNTSLKPIQIDDAGIGFPLCGVMVGISDGTEVWTDTVDVSFFKSPIFERKEYLQEYALKGLGVLSKIKGTPQTHRIEICTGHINTRLRDVLREKGFDVRVVEIKGLLQDKLELIFKNYIKTITGVDLGYDPKELQKKDLCKSYYKVLHWGQKNAPHLLKTGWNSMK